jgi:hypothetical protein
MDRRAADANAVLDRLPLGIQSGECGQQRRMNIQDPVWKDVQQRLTDQPHEPSKTNKTYLARAKYFGERRIVRAATSIIARADNERLDAGVTRAYQSCGIGTIGYDNRNRGVERTSGNCVDDRLKI